MHACMMGMRILCLTHPAVSSSLTISSTVTRDAAKRAMSHSPLPPVDVHCTDTRHQLVSTACLDQLPLSMALALEEAASKDRKGNQRDDRPDDEPESEVLVRMHETLASSTSR